MDDRDQLATLHPAIRGLKTVCRCNNVKYKTLERVIKAGAKTIAEVAKQTTATTCYCGGSCTPYIQEMIADIHGGPKPEKPKADDADENGAPAWWVRIEELTSSFHTRIQMGVPVVLPSKRPERIFTRSLSFLGLVPIPRPGRLFSISFWMSSTESSKRGGQPSITTPTA